MHAGAGGFCMSAFKVGDRVVIVSCRVPENQKFIGQEMTVIEVGCRGWGHITGWRDDHVRCDFKHHNGYLYTPETLRKIDPPSNYDGNQAGEWDLCPWRPKRERA